MVVFKVENGEKILREVAVGALNKQSFEFFIEQTTEKKADVKILTPKSIHHNRCTNAK